MLFCSSASYSGEAWASVSSSGELEPRVFMNGRRPTPEGRCVVRYQNPPTSTTTRRRRRNLITLEPETFPELDTLGAPPSRRICFCRQGGRQRTLATLFIHRRHQRR